MFYVYSYYDVYIEISYTQKNMRLHISLVNAHGITLCVQFKNLSTTLASGRLSEFLPSYILKAMIYNINLRL